MNESEFLSRRAVLGAGGLGATALLGAAVLQSSQAQANLPATTPPAFKFKSTLDYGAAPNDPGNTDLTADLQDALSDLQSNDCLVIPPGIYNIDAGVLTICADISNVRILAYGAVFQVTDSAEFSSHDVLTLSSTDPANESSDLRNISIHGLKIAAYHTTMGAGIQLVNTPRVSLHDIEIWNMGTYCLQASKSWWLTTYNCQFLAAGLASVRQDTHMNAVTHIGSRFAPHAFQTEGGNPYNPDAIGVLHHHGTAVNFIGCDFSSCEIGAVFVESNNVSMVGCYFEEVATGIQLGDGTTPAYNTTIDNCYFSLRDTNGVIGINVDRAESALIRNCFIRTKQLVTISVRYDNTKGANTNVILDANRCLREPGVSVDFNGAISYVDPLITTNMVRKYFLANA